MQISFSGEKQHRVRLDRPLREMSNNEKRTAFLVLSSALELYAAGLGIPLLCFTFYRSPTEQALVVVEGKSTARHGKHTRWRAKDYVIYDERGRAIWDVPEPPPPGNPYLILGEFWEGLHPNCRWGGRWKQPFDPYHFEF